MTTVAARTVVPETESRTSAAVERARRFSAPNYDPLPVVLADGLGAWVTDIDGRRFLDCLGGYSALNFGHCHPAIVAAVHQQVDRLTLTSRAFLNDQFGPFCEELTALCGTDLVLPMNTGAEAVETGIKVARKWGYRVKGIPDGQATIVVAGANFHGRTTTIISFSTDEQARADFGPFTPGFRVVPYADLEAMDAAIDETTAAVLIEPIQGEAGVIIPPPGYLAAVRQLCTDRNVLFICDEVQSGLGRTGTTLALEQEGVTADLYLLGKALGGGVLPVSAVTGKRSVLEVLRPGDHGSTFGGNPLSCAVARAVIALLATGEFQQRARTLGELLRDRLCELVGDGVIAVRGRGLWVGVDIDPAVATGRRVCEELATVGVLAKDTHGSTIRLAPPLVVTEDEINWAVDQFAEAIGKLTR